MFPLKRLRETVAGFASKKVVVVGDLIADEYLYGKPSRISREAPVLILRFTNREVRLGGAANAAHKNGCDRVVIIVDSERHVRLIISDRE